MAEPSLRSLILKQVVQISYELSKIPPAALKSKLDCIDLHCYQEGTNTNCKLVFDLQEQSIADYFKMIVRLDKIKKEIVFNQSELLDENLKPRVEIIAKRLAAEIEQVLTK